ncbi:MAG: ADP-glyceromanno-heptose 6-epimerase, partial [Negativicutes bacterium]|nr:ADP-glyceromanno-heptose 6-epimerase [Negativicutes bacterium]
YMMENNFEYSKQLFAFCQRHGIPFIYASSASVYGRGEQGFSERAECECPLNVYAYSKLLFDRYVLRHWRPGNSQVVGLRYFNVYGPQENAKGRMASVAYQMYRQLESSDVVRLFAGCDGYADGEQRRDFIWVGDVVEVVLHFWDNNRLSGIYNCGTGRAHSFNQVARAMIAACGRGRIEYIPFPAGLQGKYQSFTQADGTRLADAGFGPERFTDLGRAVAEYATILRDNDGYLLAAG